MKSLDFPNYTNLRLSSWPRAMERGRGHGFRCQRWRHCAGNVGVAIKLYKADVRLVSGVDPMALRMFTLVGALDDGMRKCR